MRLVNLDREGNGYTAVHCCVLSSVEKFSATRIGVDKGELSIARKSLDNLRRGVTNRAAGGSCISRVHRQGWAHILGTTPSSRLRV